MLYCSLSGSDKALMQVWMGLDMPKCCPSLLQSYLLRF